MNKQKLISCIQLINTQGIGPVNFYRAMHKYGSIEGALAEISRKNKVFPRAKAEEEVMRAEIKKVKLITFEDKEYPYNLKQIESCSPILYALGNTDILTNDNALAVVGSRNASISALKMAEKTAKEVAECDITVVSGMARGIDAAAHLGALSAGGHTIAVLGTGVDVVYPKENEALYNKIKEKGVILSEYPFGTQPQATNFPRRNRIVSGLSKGVLVIEAGERSGSLITAHLALDQGRDVYAIPGAPYDGRATGCNLLIKEGAYLVENTGDIINNFNFSPREFMPRSRQKLAETADLFEYSLDKRQNNSDIPKQKDGYEKLLGLISERGEDIDDVVRLSNEPAEEVLLMLAELEVEGKVSRLAGNKIAKR